MRTTKITLVLVAIIFSITTMAQDYTREMNTLFKKSPTHKIDNGGYGAISIGYTQIDDKDALQIGGRAAWIANHRFALGVAGYGFFNSIEKTYAAENDNSDFFLTGGYGGLFFEPIISPYSPVHISIPVILGVGGISAVQRDEWNNKFDNNNYYCDNDVFLVAEPGVDIEFNIVKFFRLAVGASYRFTNGVDLQYKYLDQNFDEQTININKDALDSFSFNLSFKFGWF